MTPVRPPVLGAVAVLEWAGKSWPCREEWRRGPDGWTRAGVVGIVIPPVPGGPLSWQELCQRAALVGALTVVGGAGEG